MHSPTGEAPFAPPLPQGRGRVACWGGGEESAPSTPPLSAATAGGELEAVERSLRERVQSLLTAPSTRSAAPDAAGAARDKAKEQAARRRELALVEDEMRRRIGELHSR
mmetsp:Transcript_1101/g.4088  ORF Transcript_1101/g.4088 Transcript_1101/m.4088 type:complete len:109 (-) Transcript_1101:49-375(-)